MTTTNAVTSSVEVAADPDTAFAVFTEELDCWWIQGPINFFDATHAYSARMEPGVGGRIVEVYDGETGEGLEVARITVWEPGARLAWQSSVDDVQIDVSFSASNGGTLVRVEATIPEGGADRGGTSWVRTTPKWFGRWIERRDHEPHEPLHMSRLAVAMHYAKPATAAQWFRDVFGFEPAGDIPENEPDDINYALDRVPRRQRVPDGVRAHWPRPRGGRTRHPHALGVRRRPRRRSTHASRPEGRRSSTKSGSTGRGRSPRPTSKATTGRSRRRVRTCAGDTPRSGGVPSRTGCSRRRSTDVRTGDQGPDE